MTVEIVSHKANCGAPRLRITTIVLSATAIGLWNTLLWLPMKEENEAKILVHLDL